MYNSIIYFLLYKYHSIDVCEPPAHLYRGKQFIQRTRLDMQIILCRDLPLYRKSPAFHMENVSGYFIASIVCKNAMLFKYIGLLEHFDT